MSRYAIRRPTYDTEQEIARRQRGADMVTAGIGQIGDEIDATRQERNRLRMLGAEEVETVARPGLRGIADRLTGGGDVMPQMTEPTTGPDGARPGKLDTRPITRDRAGKAWRVDPLAEQRLGIAGRLAQSDAEADQLRPAARQLQAGDPTEWIARNPNQAGFLPQLGRQRTAGMSPDEWDRRRRITAADRERATLLSSQLRQAEARLRASLQAGNRRQAMQDNREIDLLRMEIQALTGAAAAGARGLPSDPFDLDEMGRTPGGAERIDEAGRTRQEAVTGLTGIAGRLRAQREGSAPAPRPTPAPGRGGARPSPGAAPSNPRRDSIRARLRGAMPQP